MLPSSPSLSPIAGVLFAGVLSGLIFIWLRETRLPSERPTSIARATLLALAITLVAVILSCGGTNGSAGGGTGGPPPLQGGTPAGDYTITLRSSSSNPVAPQETVQLTFTVQ
jgi:hypothetical protein